MQKIIALSLGILLLSGGVAFAQSCVPSPGVTCPPTTPPVGDLVCATTAVDVREKAILASFTAYSTEVTAALTKRGTALVAAWSNPNGAARRAARNTAWSDYKVALKTAKANLKNAKGKAWSTFKASSKACETPIVESSLNDGI